MLETSLLKIKEQTVIKLVISFEVIMDAEQQESKYTLS